MARRRSIYDTGNYSTPLADFLEEIPNYFLKFEQLKLQNKKYDNEQAYRAARDLESDRRWDLTQKEKVKNKRLDTAKIKLTQQLNDANQIPVGSRPDWLNNLRHEYMEFPALLSTLDSRVSVLNPYVEADEKYKIIDADVSELNTLSTDESFGSHYNRLEKRNELFDATRDLAEGSKTRVKIESDIALLDKTLKFERDNAGKRRPDAEWSREDLVEFGRASGLVNAGIARQTSLRDDIIEKENKLSVLGQSVGGKSSSIYKAGAKEINDLKIEFNSLMDYKDKDGNIIKKGNISKNREIMKFIEDRNTYPELKGTPEILEGGVSGYEPKTEMKEPDIERYILNNPEQGFDAWMDFITNPSEESENKFSSMLNEFIEDPAKPIEKVIEPIQEIITDDTTDDIEDEEEQTREERWASNIKTEEKIPEDIPKAWTEPATERDTDIDLSSIVEPLIARSDKGTEATIKEREKEAGESELFPEPLKSTNVKYIISDITKSGRDTGKVRGYVHSYLGGNLKQLKDLRKRVPILEGRGDKYNLKQINEKISSLENKIRESIGDYVNPETGEFSNPEYTKRIYRSLKRTLPDLQMRELMDLLRDFSTAQGTSKAVTLEPVSTSEDGTVYSASN